MMDRRMLSPGRRAQLALAFGSLADLLDSSHGEGARSTLFPQEAQVSQFTARGQVPPRSRSYEAAKDSAGIAETYL